MLTFVRRALLGLAAGSLACAALVVPSAPVVAADATTPGVCVEQTVSSQVSGSVVGVQADSGTYLVTTTDGTIYGWGSNLQGRLLDGTQVDWATPAAASSFMAQDFDQIDFGGDVVVALKNGTVYTWGKNQYGQLGIGTFSAPSVAVGTPQQVTALAGKTVTQVAAGWGWAAAVTSEGELYTWGYNNWGTLGHTSTGSESGGAVTNVPTPTQVTGIPAVSAVFPGSWSGLALTTDGDVWGWGNPTSGVLGNGRTDTVDGNWEAGQTPTRIAQLSGLGLTEIALTEATGAGRTSTGAVYTWGDTVNGATGQASPSWPALPARILADQVITSLGGDYGFSNLRGMFTALNDQGDVYFWGDNYLGTAGNGTTTAVLTPTLVDLGGRTVTMLSSGGGSTSVVTDTGELLAWGNTPDGNLTVPTALMQFGTSTAQATAHVTSVDLTWDSDLSAVTDYRITWPGGSTTVAASELGTTLTGLVPATAFSIEIAPLNAGVTAAVPIVIEVTTLSPGSYTLSASATSVQPGASVTVTAAGTDQDGQSVAVPFSDSVVLTSSDPTDVITAGDLVAGTAGARTLTVTGPCSSATVALTVAAAVDPTPAPTVDPTTGPDADPTGQPTAAPTAAPTTPPATGTSADPKGPGILAITGPQVAGLLGGALAVICAGIGLTAWRRRHTA